jgi:threonine aldolase
VIDLRSDTVTLPTPAMRQAIADAELGDDVYGEDPSVRRLQEQAAARLGKDAALFVPSGSMANLASVLTHTRPGDLVLASPGAHLLLYEGGGAAALGGVQIQTLGRGFPFAASDVHAAIAPDDAHFAPTRLLCLENTHNTAGGRVVPFDVLEEVTDAAREHDLRLHLDGARLFNAEVKSGIPAARWAEPFDTVSFCLSKGLGAPVGSLVCGDVETIRRVHRVRKMLGGGMRQAGVLAAAGSFALEHHVKRLAEDHANALRLAEGLEKLGLPVRPRPETNLVLFQVEDTRAFLHETRAREVLVNPTDEGRFRAVTHLGVSTSDIDDALERIGAALGR